MTSTTTTNTTSPSSLLQAIIDENHLSIKDLKHLSGIRQHTLKNILKGKKTIDQTTAEKLEQATKVKSNKWMQLQKDETRRQEREACNDKWIEPAPLILNRKEYMLIDHDKGILVMKYKNSDKVTIRTYTQADGVKESVTMSKARLNELAKWAKNW